MALTTDTLTTKILKSAPEWKIGAIGRTTFGGLKNATFFKL